MPKKQPSRGGGRVSPFSEAQQLQFVKSVQGLKTSDIEVAAKKLGISIQTYFNWLKKYKDQLKKPSQSRTYPPTQAASIATAVNQAGQVPKGEDRTHKEQVIDLKRRLMHVIMNEKEVSKLKDDVLSILVEL